MGGKYNQRHGGGQVRTNARVPITVGVLGGSFDPPHIGHQTLCLMALELAALHRVLVVPTFQHALDKPLVASFADRVSMCNLAFALLSSRVEVNPIEGSRGPGPSRMLDTLDSLQRSQRSAVFRLIVGSDILHETHRWYRWTEISERFPPLVFARVGFQGGQLPGPPEVSSNDVRKQLMDKGTTPLVSASVLDYIGSRELYR